MFRLQLRRKGGRVDQCRGRSPYGGRGQVSAPVELMVAVFVMGMALTLAFVVMDRTHKEQCFAELKTQTLNFQAAMQDVSFASPPTSRTINFKKPASCGFLGLAGIRIVYYDDPNYCGLCPNSYGSCWQIVPISFDSKLGRYYPIQEAVSCIDIPGRIDISQDPSCSVDPDKPALKLSKDPCPPEFPGCDSGVPDKVSGNDPSNPTYNRFATLSASKKGYEITLAKGVGASSAAETGSILVCAKEA